MTEPIQFEIDAERFKRHFPARLRRQTTIRAWQAIDNFPGANEEFFGHMHTYHHQRPKHDDLWYPDLFAPNLCAIDFMLGRIDNMAPDIILDWGCGLGVCAAYLAAEGFSAYGYDDWSQVPKRAAFSFQAGCDRSAILLEDWRSVRPTVVMHVSIWAPSIEVWGQPSVEWILSDSHYLHSFDGGHPAGFRKFGEYRNAMTVFKRIDP